MCVQADIVWGAKLCVTGCVRELPLGQGSTWMWASKCTRVCVTLCSPMCFMLLVGVGGGGGVGPGAPLWTFQKPPGHA